MILAVICELQLVFTLIIGFLLKLNGGSVTEPMGSSGSNGATAGHQDDALGAVLVGLYAFVICCFIVSIPTMSIRASQSRTLSSLRTFLCSKCCSCCRCC